MRTESFMCLTCAKETDHHIYMLDNAPLWLCGKCVNKGMYGKVDYLE